MAKQLRQRLLVLCSSDPNLHSRIVAWAEYDGTGRTRASSGQEAEPPYPSIVHAMQDGWRVIQFPQQFPAYLGMEHTTSYLRYEFVLEKLEEVDVLETQHLLNSKQMARFVADGYLLFEDMVPDHMNRAVLRDFEEMKRGDLWRQSKAIQDVFALPEIRGITHSLVGPNPLYDHHAVHTVEGGNTIGQVWHADAIIDTSLRFDIQYMYFAHDCPREMGGTMILPSSHFRRISCTDVTRHHNFLGQKAMACKAGTVLVVHMGIWHCAQPNHTDSRRYMFKLRLNPSVRQLRLWNTEDIDDPSIGSILHTNHPWHGNEDRIEVVNRIRLWRFLTGNDGYDTGYWMTRIENHPTELVGSRQQTTGARQEAIRMAIPILDTHQHLWDLKRFPYSWTAGNAVLERSFLLPDYLAAIEGLNVVGSVHVEAAVDPPNQLRETEWLAGLAGSGSPIRGLVASAAPESEAFAGQLKALVAYPIVKGVRRVLHTEKEPLARQPRFIDNIRRLAEHDLSYDLCVDHTQLPDAIALARAVPEVRFVLDHCGVPDIKNRVQEPWRAHMREIASLSNVSGKVSGVVAYADHQRWTPRDLAPFVEHTIDCFGWDRVMFGSDWPVCTQAASLRQWVEALQEIVAGASEEQKRLLFHDNALRIYRLNP